VIVPDYSKFEDVQLLKLYNEIEGLGTEAADKLLLELHARGLINMSKRIETKLDDEVKKKLNSKFLSVFKISEEEINLHRGGNISQFYFDIVKSATKSENSFSLVFSIIFFCIMIPIFTMVNKKLDLFNNDHPDILNHYLIILFSLLLPVFMLLWSVYRKVNQRRSLTNLSVESITGVPVLSKIKIRRTLLYNYFVRVKNKSFQINKEQYMALNSEYILRFYYLSKLNVLVSLEFESTGRYHVVEA